MEDLKKKQIGEPRGEASLRGHLKAEGVELLSEADESTKGPASFVTVDPDGNPILVDQHV